MLRFKMKREKNNRTENNKMTKKNILKLLLNLKKAMEMETRQNQKM